MSRTASPVFVCLLLACGAVSAADQPPSFKSNVQAHAPHTFGNQKNGRGVQRGPMLQHSSSSSSSFYSVYGGLTTLNHSQRSSLYSLHPK